MENIDSLSPSSRGPRDRTSPSDPGSPISPLSGPGLGSGRDLVGRNTDPNTLQSRNDADDPQISTNRGPADFIKPGENVSVKPETNPSQHDRLSIGIHLVPSQPGPPPRLFFKTLNKRTTRESVLAALSQEGTVVALRMPFSERKGKNLGYGFVQFESAEVSDRLVADKTDVFIDGKKIGFDKFDIQKYKTRSLKTESAHSCPEPQPKRSPRASPPRLLPNSDGGLSPVQHGLKPTAAGYHRLRSLNFDPRHKLWANFRLNCHRRSGSARPPTSSRSDKEKRDFLNNSTKYN